MVSDTIFPISIRVDLAVRVENWRLTPFFTVKLRKWVSGTLYATLVCLLLPATATADTLHRGAGAEPGTLDPQIASGNASAILRDLNMGLTTFDETGQIIPGAAESWEISDDGLTYRFYLRGDLRWSDGSPMTAEDFSYSMRRLMNPETGARFGPFFYAIKNSRDILRGKRAIDELGVRAEDDRTVVFELSRPAASFLQNLANFAASPLPRSVIEEHGRGWARPGRLISSGPYRLAEWLPQSHILLEKNPYFYDADTVRMEHVQYYPTTNVETALRRYQAGELDILLRFPPDRIEWIHQNMPGQLKIWPALAISYIILNHDHAPFDDVRVREALSISVDRQRIAEQIMRTGVTPAYTLTPDAVSNYDPPVPEYAGQSIAVRMERARELLKEAGYSRTAPLEFELRYEPLEESRRIAVALQAAWREIGANVELLHTDFGTLNRAVRTGGFAASRFVWYAPSDDPETFLGLVESTNPNNHTGYENADVDRLVSAAGQTLDPAARLALYREAEGRALADHPNIPIYFLAFRYLVKPDIRGFNPNSRGVNPSRYLWRATETQARTEK